MINNEFDAVLGRLKKYNNGLRSNELARNFLNRRGFSNIDNLIHRFKIGSSTIRDDFFEDYIVFPIFRKKSLQHMTGRYYGADENVIKHKHLYGNIEHYFNHDIIFRADWLIIVESPICALSLCECGYPAMAALGQGKTPDYFRDISRDQTVYILNDADRSGAGFDGAQKQAALLKNKTKKVYIGRLPLPRRVDKADINDYFKDMPRREFEGMIEDVLDDANLFKGERKKTRRGKRTFKGDTAWRNDYDIVEILSEHVEDLTEAGASFLGYCPLHEDSNKSFMVNPETASWSCLGRCKTGGDVAKFFMIKYDISFPEALDLLKENYG